MLIFQSILLSVMLPFVTPMFGYGTSKPPLPPASGGPKHHVLPPSGPFESSKDPIVFKDPKVKDTNPNGFPDGIVVLDKLEELHFPPNGKILCSYKYDGGTIESIKIKAKEGTVKIEKQEGGATSYNYIKLRVHGSGTVKIYVEVMGEKSSHPKPSKTKGLSCNHAQTKSGS